MSLVLSEEQTMLRDAARGFLEEKAPVSALRELRDSQDDLGFDPALWNEMADMGWAGILIEEEYGGSGFGFVGAGVLAEEMGRTLAASPYMSTAVLAATTIQKLGAAGQKESYLPQIAAGTLLFALAVDETRKHDPAKTAMQAVKHGNGFKLSGMKTFVADGDAADKFIVAARTAGSPGDQNGITLFLIDGEKKGLSRERAIMVDSRNFARLHFDQVEADGEDVIGDIDGGFTALEGVLNAARAGLAAELSGAAQQAFAMTTDYLKQRKQFDAPIGSFQALQHRAAHLYTELELTKSAILKALQELDANYEHAGPICSLAKAKASEAAKLSSQEAIQMHGGIGMTDEFDIGFYMKRIRVAQEMFGESAFHTDRLAAMRGY